MERNINALKDKQVNYLNAPISVWWDITHHCNLNCLHCYSNSTNKKPGVDELTYSEATNIIEQLAEQGVFFIYFLGGEPFMRPDFLDLLDVVASHGMSFLINTNGWFITQELARDLKRLGARQVRVSLDGSKAETHDALRNMQGSFERVLSAIKYLIDAGIPQVSVVSTISKRNISELEDIIDLAAYAGADNIQCLVVSQSGRGAENFDDLGIDPSSRPVITQILEDKRTEYSEKMLVYSSDGLLPSECAICTRETVIRPHFMGCQAARTCCNIDHNGDVIPCLLVRKPVFGNLRQQPFEDIWHHSEGIRKWRSKTVEFAECRSCEWNDICLRECPLSSTQIELAGDMREKVLRGMKRGQKENTKCINFLRCSM
jgi:radical SAM protein with 4Fe4S-binding SPASM domain